MKHPFAFLVATFIAMCTAVVVFAYDGEQYVTCRLDPNGDNFLALRSCGSADCTMLKKLGPGTFVITTEPTGTDGWRPVIVQTDMQDWSYAGPSGWVFEKYICQVDLTE